MSERPEYVHCVEHDHADLKGTSWCGRRLWSMDWRFVDIDHAANNGLNGGRLVACPACVTAITTALRNGHEDA
jgi:hypothetical protein